ncbi:MAG: potassium channel family protein, partial [Ilumatobacter sp.]
MLKSLGVVISQATQQARALGSRGRGDDARQIAQRTERRRRRKTVLLLAFVFVVLVLVFSFLFHELMAREGRSYSWPTSIYWTMTTMTTLGFGDITFTSDLGRLFSVVVLISGSAFLLVVLPFTFIQFVFIPWINERERRRAPRTLPESMSGHLILTALGPVEQVLIERADKTDLPYVLVVEDVDEAGRLHDEGRRVLVGALDDPTTYQNARV